MNAVVKMLLPMILPRVQKEAATYAANYLNRRHRRRYGLPEPEFENTCPPCPARIDCSGKADTLKGILSVTGSILAGVFSGAAAGALLARK